MDLDNLFDSAHADTLERMKIEEDKMFSNRQRKPGHPGCLAGVDKKIAEKEERSRQQKVEVEKIKKAASTSLTSHELSHQELDVSFLSSDESLPETSNVVATDTSRKRGRKDFVSMKLEAAFYRCQLSIRDSVYIIWATVEALGFSTDKHPINKSSIQRVQSQMRMARAKDIMTDFLDCVPGVITVHWDSKLLPGLDVRSIKEERLPVLIFEEKELLLAVPKLDSSSRKAQAKAVLDALHDWNLDDQVEIMCCNTTASNTGRLNGACVLLKQRLERGLFLK